MQHDLLEDLPANLAVKVRETLNGDETILLTLKGAFKEALVCTDRRVMVLKTGFMTGNMFGVNVFQLPYKNISSVEVKFGMMTGYFELSTGGVQNTIKSYWTNGGTGDAKQAPNSISITSREMADRFRAACNLIMAKVSANDVHQVHPPIASVSVADEIAKLAALVRDGFLTQAEFEAQKQSLLIAGSGPTAPTAEATPEQTDIEDSHDKAKWGHLDRMIDAELERQASPAKRPDAETRPVFGRRRS